MKGELRMKNLSRWAGGLLAWLCCAWPWAVQAEPYLAIQQGLACSVCHVNPTGGGLRSAYGAAFSRQVLPASVPEGLPDWNGALGDHLRLGGDLRETYSRNSVPQQRTQQAWQLEQFRLYGEVALLPQRLSLALDQAMAPGSSHTQEAYVHYRDPEAGWYAKAGQFYLPFGWRLQDNTAFVREVSGISMTTPDQGVELGLERPGWSAQLDLTNGAANAGTGSGHQVTGQWVWVQPQWRAGLAASGTQSQGGNRRVMGVFGGAVTGPLAWLAEVDQVQDDGFPEGGRRLRAMLAEVNWKPLRGHNVKLTWESLDPDRSVANDRQVRYSLLYELTPLPSLQLRAGYRRYDGIPQNDLQNRRLLFMEVHGFF